MVEKCIGIFSTNIPGDDDLPDILLHSEECWNKSGPLCPDFPRGLNLPPDELQLPNDDGIFEDLDYYEPTLHTNMANLLVWDLTVIGCFPDWDNIQKIMKKYTRKVESQADKQMWYFIILFG